VFTTIRASSKTRLAQVVKYSENIATFQNAADLEWSATDPANAGVRDQFRLGDSPNHDGNHTPPPPHKHQQQRNKNFRKEIP